jgi:hypothetical protein
MDESPLWQLDLSIRSQNALRRGGYRYLSEVQNASDAQLLQIANFGARSLEEVRSFAATAKGEKAVDPEDVRVRHPVRLKLAQMFNVDENLLSEIERSSLPISELLLPLRPLNTLTKLKVGTVGDLLQLEESELLAVRNFGVKSFGQIERSFRNWLEKFLAVPRSDPMASPSSTTIKLSTTKLLGSIIESVAKRDFEIWRFRLGYQLANTPTLEEVGIKYKLTRERVRQVDKSVGEMLLNSLKQSMDVLDPIFQCLQCSLPKIEIEYSWPNFKVAVQEILSEFDSDLGNIPDDQLELLLWASGPIERIRRKSFTDGKLISVFYYHCSDDNSVQGFNELLSTLRPSSKSFISETEILKEIRSRHVLRPDLSDASIRKFILEICGLQKYGDLGFGPRNCPIGDLAEQMLILKGSSATVEEIQTATGSTRSAGSIRNVLASDDRFVRSGLKIYGLQDWGVSPYEGISDEIAKRIIESGGWTDIESLISELPELGVSRNSVKIYLDNPRFFVEGSKVRLRKPSEIARADPDIRHRENWWWINESTVRYRLLVDRDVTRGSGHGIGESESSLLGIGFGDSRTFINQGWPDLTISWPQGSMNPSISSLRNLAETLHLDDGDWFFIDFDILHGRYSPRQSVVGRGSNLFELLDAFIGTRPERLTGLNDFLAKSLGCPPTFEAVMGCLHARKLGSIADHLEMLGGSPNWPSIFELGQMIVDDPGSFGFLEAQRCGPSGLWIETRSSINPRTVAAVFPTLAERKDFRKSKADEFGLRIGLSEPGDKLLSEFECFWIAHNRKLGTWAIFDANQSEDVFAEDLPEIVWLSQKQFERSLSDRDGVWKSKTNGLVFVTSRSENLGDGIDEFSRHRYIESIRPQF